MGFFSDLFGSEESTEKSFEETINRDERLDPYAGTDPALQNLLSQLTELTGQDYGAFQGDRVADLNDLQRQGLDDLVSFAGGRGADLASSLGDTGMGLLSGVQGDMDASRGYYDDLIGLAGSDPIQAGQIDLDYANSIAQNPYLDEMIDASLRDSSRNFSENILPGVALDSAASGNLGSSRRGAYEAIAQRGAMDRAADVGAGVRGNAYNMGLGLADAQVGRQFAGDLSQRDQALRALLSGATGSAGLAGMGMNGANMIGQGFDMERMLPGLISGAGDVYQRQEQAEIGGDMAAFNESQMLPIQYMANLMDITMAPATAFGTTFQNQTAQGTSESTTTSTPSVMDGIGQMAQIGATIATGMPFGGAGGGADVNSAAAGQVASDFWGGMPQGQWYNSNVPGYG